MSYDLFHSLRQSSHFCESEMITKKFGVDFNSDGGALTLSARQVTSGQKDSGTHSRTHGSGWTIKGEIHEDYYRWVNDFEAEHPEHGKVWGNFESEVNADSEEGFKHFWENHEPEAWDYMDI